MRVTIYARYSSDNQRDASIDDQIRLCKERIAREGWTLVQVYRDAAVSGSSALRPEYQALLEATRQGEFDVAVAEALDRLSRDQEDVAALYKRLRFAGIQLLTLAEGEINELHVGLKGTMNALFLKDLADKTRRGLGGASLPASQRAALPTDTSSFAPSTHAARRCAATAPLMWRRRRSCAASFRCSPMARRRSRSPRR
jgi:hypothetical protein